MNFKRIVLGVCCILFCFSKIGFAEEEGVDYWYWVRTGIGYERNKDYDGALYCFNKAVEEHPGDRIFYNYRASFYAQQKNYPSAIADYTSALELDPSVVVNYSSRAKLYEKRQQYDEALLDYTTELAVVAKRNETAQYKYVPKAVYRDRAALYYRLGRYDEAFADYTEEINAYEAEDPSDKRVDFNVRRRGTAYCARGNVSLVKKDYAAAIQDFSDAIKIAPACVPGYFYRGKAYLLTQEYEKAIADYDEALAGNLVKDKAGQIIIHINRGEAYAGVKDYDKALADYDAALIWEGSHMTCIG